MRGRARRPTRRRCSSSPTRSASASATPRWCSARPATAACTWWPTSRPRRSSAACAPTRSCARRRRWWAAAAAAATRWRRPAAATRRSCPTRSPRRGSRSSGRSRLMGRVLALDHGSARCGCAVSDPSGTLASVLPAVERPDTRAGLSALVRLVEEQDVERVVVGLPLTLAGEEGAQAAEARAFAERLAGRLAVPVELHDERLTTRLAERTRRRRRPRLARRRAPARELPDPRRRGPDRVSGRTAAGPGRPLARGARGRAPRARGAPPGPPEVDGGTGSARRSS